MLLALSTSTLAIISQFTIGLLGVVIAGLLYRSNQHQAREAHLNALRQFQLSFWNDPDMSDVRAWIACEGAYEPVSAAFHKRMSALASNLCGLDREEYRIIEQADKFAATLLGYRLTTTHLSRSHDEAMYRLFDAYWIDRASRADRSALAGYLRTFYPELLKS